MKSTPCEGEALSTLKNNTRFWSEQKAGADRVLIPHQLETRTLSHPHLPLPGTCPQRTGKRFEY